MPTDGEVSDMTGSLWKFGIALVFALVAAAAIGFDSISWYHPTLLAALVVPAAALCALTAGWLLLVAHRNNQAELGLTAGFFMVVSILALAHGLLLPGALFGDNSASAATVFWTVPIGAMAITPVIGGHRRRSEGLSAWRMRVMLVAGVALAVATVSLIWRELIPVPAAGSGWAIASAIAIYGFLAALSLRHVELAAIAGAPGPLAIGAGFVLVGGSNLVLLGGGDFAPHFWLAHALDIAGVAGATILGAIVYRRTESASQVMGPVVAIDPLSALELGLHPVVHRFVADLESKDQITRDHVVRTAGLVVTVGGEMGLPTRELVAAGIGGVLHDIGKLEIPDEILTKPGSLTDEEFAVIRTHPVIGAGLLADHPHLADAVPAVRWHHERVDGRGYPDALEAGQIPLIARIVAACDAFDAMTVTRHYRGAMTVARAHEILRELAGKQWDCDVVDAVISVTRNWGADRDPSEIRHLASVGEQLVCDCIPDSVSA